MFLLRLLINPWVFSGFVAAFLASLAWMAAMTKFDISHAYPFMSLNFVLVILAGGLLFHEAITPYKLAGLALIVAGLIVGSRGCPSRELQEHFAMANDIRIPFNRPHMTGKELWYIAQAHQAGNWRVTARSPRSATRGWSSARRRKKALLTHSCTAALEMAAILAGVGAGRRSDHAVVHLRLDGQCLRAARRDAGVRGHPAGHAEHRRGPDRGGDHAAHQGDRRRCTMPASAARWTRSWRSPAAQAAGDRGCRAGPDGALQGAAAGQHRAAGRA